MYSVSSKNLPQQQLSSTTGSKSKKRPFLILIALVILLLSLATIGAGFFWWQSINTVAKETLQGFRPTEDSFTSPEVQGQEPDAPVKVSAKQAQFNSKTKSSVELSLSVIWVAVAVAVVLLLALTAGCYFFLQRSSDGVIAEDDFVEIVEAEPLDDQSKWSWPSWSLLALTATLCILLVAITGWYVHRKTLAKTEQKVIKSVHTPLQPTEDHKETDTKLAQTNQPGEKRGVPESTLAGDDSSSSVNESPEPERADSPQVYQEIQKVDCTLPVKQRILPRNWAELGVYFDEAEDSYTKRSVRVEDVQRMGRSRIPAGTETRPIGLVHLFHDLEPIPSYNLLTNLTNTTHISELLRYHDGQDKFYPIFPADLDLTREYPFLNYGPDDVIIISRGSYDSSPNVRAILRRGINAFRYTLICHSYTGVKFTDPGKEAEFEAAYEALDLPNLLKAYDIDFSDMTQLEGAYQTLYNQFARFMTNECKYLGNVLKRKDAQD